MRQGNNPYAAFGTQLITKKYTFVNPTAAGTYNLFTVTGDVIVRIIPVVSTTIAAGVTTICLGIAGSTDYMIADTSDGTLTARRIWTDAIPSDEIEATDTIRDYIITDGNDVVMEVKGDNITGGEIIFYCFFTNLSSNGNVTIA